MTNPLRKTMVYLGLADEEIEYEDALPAAPVAPAPASAPATAGRAPVTPLRRSPRPAAAAGELNEILTVHPRKYSDVTVIAENFREGIPVIANLTEMSESEARRLIDFAGGLTKGLYGRIERVTTNVFLLTPSHVAISGDPAAPEDGDGAGFFGQ